MNQATIIDRIHEIGIIPVIRAENSSQALFAVRAIAEGGIPISEITMTVPGALEAIRASRRAHNDSVLIGAGTVLNVEMARACLDAGAQFLISPGVDDEILRLAADQKFLFIPGAMTPTEIMGACAHGAELIKLFPANQGGPSFLKTLRGPFPDIRFIPTGGVTLNNLADFFAAGAFAVGVGSELVNTTVLRSGDHEALASLARRFSGEVNRSRTFAERP
jgi:2-dehydro-3-deoxyphosphogluconate aldolase / (4S)-4-hydroxy-2-oxoglutarate aldolase